MRRPAWTRVAAAVAVATPAAFAVLVMPAASAAPALAAPDVQFTASGPGTVTATVHNKNTQQGTVCWATDTDNKTVFGSGGQDSYAGPGRTITVSIRNLPNGPIHAQAFCAYHTPPLGSHDYTSSTAPTTVTVTGGAPTGSAG
ncbi:hypothetical protein K7711_30005 [Nocardia sp. CA2R105]|uniref:Uncharacterized protein n=1 Tax=Nocardia jiangxiensis TaxID=282685 RepID=A0ABW6RYJ3_9NOCA|nr:MULTISPECIES: hypothetical protein [Nocardia]MBY8860741.1 hypothetical protein [Nocardia coffeae]